MAVAAPDVGHGTAGRWLWTALAAFTAGITLYGAYRAETSADWICAMIVLYAGIVSCIAWLALWRGSLPIMPLFAVMHVLNYGIQFLSPASNVLIYTDDERLTAAFTIAGFLLAASAAWMLVMSFKVRFRAANLAMDAERINTLLPWGFAIAMIFNWLVMTGIAFQLDGFHSVARAIGGTIMNVCAFLLGALWSSRALRRGTRIACVVLFGAGLVLTLPSVHLYASLFVIAVCLVGYVFGAGRIPVAAIAVILVVFSILQAGKLSIREQYWSEDAPVSSVQAIPGFLANWVREGVIALASPAGQGVVQIEERVGLTHMLMRVQNMSPEEVEYSYGETYALIPQMIVPRFIDPEKPSANAGLIMLNIRYGILTTEDTFTTSVGWGLISEAYANFGLAGVIGIGVLIGILMGVVGVWASGAPPLSARTAVAIVFMAVMFNLEGDAALVVTGMFQGAVAVLVVVYTLGAFGNRRRPPPVSPATAHRERRFPRHG